MRTHDLLAFIKEREAIRLRKEAGKPKPWTKDPILQQYSFCNVHREDDRVTRWIAENWRDPWPKFKEKWFWMCIARLVNWPDTLVELPLPSFPEWDPDVFVGTLHLRRHVGEKIFGGAYIVSTNGRAMDKAEYLARHVLAPLWAAREELRPTKQDTLQSFYQRLQGFNGMGSFMAAQVVADVKYTPVLRQASDWWTFAASGPGSRRGLNRVLHREVDAPWREDKWLAELGRLHSAITPMLMKAGIGELHRQDLQNCLCEFDKYERTRLGEGRPRATYPGLKGE